MRGWQGGKDYWRRGRQMVAGVSAAERVSQWHMNAQHLMSPAAKRATKQGRFAKRTSCLGTRTHVCVTRHPSFYHFRLYEIGHEVVHCGEGCRRQSVRWTRKLTVYSIQEFIQTETGSRPPPNQEQKRYLTASRKRSGMFT